MRFQHGLFDLRNYPQHYVEDGKLRHGLPPAQRQRLIPDVNDNVQFWNLRT
ncbi:MAG: hypothetical protein JJ992_30320 [Planctomycetes bacterium]|nr:hypothetical protein [Planctomycetota bacterium]